MSGVFAKNVADSSSLINHALLRLLPDVFFHPVWTHFVEAGAPLLPGQIQSLLDASDDLLARGDFVEACQTLFICAFQQMRAGDFGAASNNIQRILILAEQHGLHQVACWATWGAAAVCVRRGWFRQAAEHLEHLQSLLGQQQEWVLSGVIDLIRRALLSQAQAEATAGPPLSSDAELSSAFEQMLQWGTPRAARGIDPTSRIDRHSKYSIRSHSRPAGFSWHLLWRSIKRILTGELSLKWVETNGSVSHSSLAESNVALPTLFLPPLDQAASADWPIVITEDPPARAEEQSEPGPPELEQLPLSTPSQTALPEASPAPVQVDSIEKPAEKPAATLSIMAHLLGSFGFTVNDAAVQSWPTGRGRAVLKYLLAHHTQPILRDVLMDAFWPQAGPDAARNSLNVALYGLRQALKTVTDMPVVMFEDGAYHINPESKVWVDVDEFDRHVQAGHRLEAKERLTQAITEYEAAAELYQGDFLAGDLYEEWPVLMRERLRVDYLDSLDRLSQIYFDRRQYATCLTACHQILARDNCREDAHCRLMQCYCRQGQYHLALRQYQTCVEVLRTELNVEPALTTTQLYERIRRREHV